MGTAPEVVEEVTPRAFMVVRRHWDRVRTSNPRAYLFAIARNEACRLVKDGYLLYPFIRVDVAGIDVANPHNEVDGLADRLANQQLVKRLLERLPPRQREILTLRYLEGFNVRETAGIMKTTPGTIKRGTSDALATLRAFAERPDNHNGRDKEVGQQ